ncbi:MAG: translation initiation factor IF-3, partial [Planctomycetota bacterium]
CKITDYGKYKYELSKNRPGPKQKSQELKEVRLGRSMKIDEHDVGIRVAQARKFLMEGHKVQLVAQFRGREMAHKGIGIERLKKIVEELGDISKVETPMRSAGRRMNMILSPDKQRIETIKRRQEAERAKAAAGAEEVVDEQPELGEGGIEIPEEVGAPVEGADSNTSTRSKSRDEPVDDPEDTLERMMSEMNTL